MAAKTLNMNSMSINKFRIIIAFITIVSAMLIRSINFALTNPQNESSFALASVLTYLTAIWTFNILYYKAEDRIAFKSDSVKISLRIILNILLSLLLIFSGALYSAYHEGISLDYPHLIITVMRGLLFDTLALITLYTIDYLYKLQRIEVENEKLKTQNLSAQLQLLKQQMQPHFLFNSLNTLKSVVKSDAESAGEFIMRLSDFYRFTLQTNMSDKIPVSEELEILNTYIYLLKKRFEENIVFNINLRNTEKIQVPPLALQTLVENCVKHNVISMSKPLHVDIYEENGNLIVKNNLQRKNISGISSHTGLDNLRRRYMLLCGKEIEVEETVEEFAVKLPVIE
jgi:sensor histidine kinase YesM